MLELSFESGEGSLSVRRFRVREAISAPFEISIEARSPDEDLDFEDFVGKGASFRLRGAGGGRLFRGVCSAMEHLRAEPGGLSSYALRIVPALWLLSQRRNYRVFQHRSVPEIVQEILAEWGLEAAWRIAPDRHPRLEYRVQYGESDLDLVTRLLEDAGIAYVLPGREDLPTLVFTDDLRAGEEHPIGPIPFVDDPSASGQHAHVTGVRISREVRPGRHTLRDVDFRRSVRYQLLASAGTGTLEDRLEHFRYAPGSFVVEGGPPAPDTPTADAAGVARHDERAGRLLAEQALARERAQRSAVSFHTNVDLWAGALFSIAQHPRPELEPGRRLLVTELSTEGAPGEEWTRAGKAALIGPEQPYHPPMRAPRPRVDSLQTAVVVGPEGEEIHTDEYGRVRVQFPWDRAGRYDERSSSWIRVSQAWAGGAYGLLALPRVGQEVLVGFLEGDPDQPIIVGRVFNQAAPVPYKLPQQKTVSTWKSASTPGAEGFNEILFDDAKGSERVYIQAERNLERLVKVDESVTIGNDLTKTVRANEVELTGVSRTIAVGVNRTTTIGAADTTVVGVRHAVTVARPPDQDAAAPTGIEMVDGRITLSTGQSKITLEGPNITLEAAAALLLQAATNITVNSSAHIRIAAGASVTIEAEDGEVLIQGGPMVRINPEPDPTDDDDDDEAEDEDDNDDDDLHGDDEDEDEGDAAEA